MKKSGKLYVVFALLLFVLSACTLANSSEELSGYIGDSNGEPSSSTFAVPSQPDEVFRYTILNSSAITPNKNHQKVDKEFIDSIKDFSSKVAKETLNKSANELISTFGLYSNLLMVMEATTGETKTQLETLLSLGFNYDLSNFAKVLSNLSIEKRSVYDDALLTKTIFKNAFFLGENYSNLLKEDYFHNLRDNFDADIISGNLSSNSAINFLIEYITNNTNGFLNPKYEELETLKDYSFWFLNTDFIMDTWNLGPYSSNNGDNFVFTNINGERLYDLPYFFGKETMIVNEGEDYYSIKINGYCFNFTIMVPKDDVDISNFYTNNINNLIFDNYTCKSYKEVSFFIPCFEVESGGKFKETIASLGANKVYDMYEAEFSFLDSDEEFHLKETLQMSKLKVNKYGFEGASYTVSYGEPTSPQPDDEIEKLIFKADRPFLYKIESNKDNIPIYIGSIVDLNSI